MKRNTLPVFFILALIIFQSAISMENMSLTDSKTELKKSIKNNISIEFYPISLLFKTITFRADYFISEKSSLGFMFDRYFGKAYGRNVYKIGLRYKHYFSKSALDNSWLISIPFSYFSFKEVSSFPRTSGITIGALGGYQWYLNAKKNFFLQSLVGIDYYNSTHPIRYRTLLSSIIGPSQYQYKKSGIVPVLELNFGIRF